MIRVALMPMKRTTTLLKMQTTTMRPKVKALAALTRYGFSSPPAPSEFCRPTSALVRRWWRDVQTNHCSP